MEEQRIPPEIVTEWVWHVLQSTIGAMPIAFFLTDSKADDAVIQTKSARSALVVGSARSSAATPFNATGRQLRASWTT
jgi:hypothetical protein